MSDIQKKNYRITNYLQYDGKRKFFSEMHLVRDTSQATLLHHAAKYGNEDLVKYLIDRNSEIDALDNQGLTPLMIAVAGGHDKIVKLLLEANANVTFADSQCKNALQMFLERKPIVLEILSNLFEHVTLQNIKGVITSGEIVKKLFQAGSTAQSILNWGNVKIIDVLLRLDASIRSDTHNLRVDASLLHTAVRLKNLKIAKLLLDYGADVNIMDNSKAIPLYYLYAKGYENENPEFLGILKIAFSRSTLLNTSTVRGHMEVRNILKYGNPKIIEIILQSNFDLNISDEKGNTALHYLIQNRMIDFFKLMRGKTFDVNAWNNEGITYLHLATKKNFLHAIHFLLESGANINVIFYHRVIPDKFERQTLELLLQYGADPQKCFYYFKSCNSMLLEKYLDRAEPILARIAMIQKLGSKIIHEINSQEQWKNYFDMCRQQVRQMKKTKFYNNVTLLDFLTKKERNILAYIRNEELVLKLVVAINKLKLNSPYRNLLQNRLTRAIQLAKLKETAIADIFLLKNVPYCIAENVVEYLNGKDMENLNLAVVDIMYICNENLELKGLINESEANSMIRRLSLLLADQIMQLIVHLLEFLRIFS